MPRVLITISDSFPYGAAYASRVRALSKLLQQSGYKVDILCDYISGDANTQEYGQIFPVASRQYRGWRKLLILPLTYERKLESVITSKKYDFIVSRSMFDRFNAVLKLSKKYLIPLILESCEWYDVRSFRRGKWDIRNFQFNRFFNILSHKADGVIAISRLLETHYKKYLKNVVRIPAILEVEKISYRTVVEENELHRFLFSGNIDGGKEQFSELFVAISQIPCFEKKLVLNIYGPSEAAILSSLSDKGKSAFNKIRKAVVFNGKVTQKEMAHICSENDYGIFFRPDRRSSHAGFPTKLGEYLAAGTPVITNDTGDISLILKDGINGFLLTDYSVENIRKTLERCLNMSLENRKEMRIAARESALKDLDYSCYTKTIKCLLDFMIE